MLHALFAYVFFTIPLSAAYTVLLPLIADKYQSALRLISALTIPHLFEACVGAEGKPHWHHSLALDYTHSLLTHTHLVTDLPPRPLNTDHP